MKLKNEGVEIYISSWDWFIHLLNEWDNSVLKRIMSEIMMYEKEQLGKNPHQGSQMPMNERTNKLTISELEKLGKDNIEQLVERSNISSKVLSTVLIRSCPVEQTFKAIKSKLRSIGGISIINFENEEGIVKIFRWLNLISNHSLIKEWIDIIREAKRNISNRQASSSQSSYYIIEHLHSDSGKVLINIRSNLILRR